jgi:hypothetical protein
MKARDWQQLLAVQARQGKALFTPTELANVSGVPRRILNVELTRLVKCGVLARYAQGLYGLPDRPVPLELLLGHLDPHAYVTGMYALMRQGFVTQVPAMVSCFTSRRHFNRLMETPDGRLEFVTVRPPIYRREAQGMARPEQALCDFVYLALRRGHDPAALLTFRRLNAFKPSRLARLLKRYPSTVGTCVWRILNAEGAPKPPG